MVSSVFCERVGVWEIKSLSWVTESVLMPLLLCSFWPFFAWDYLFHDLNSYRDVLHEHRLQSLWFWYQFLHVWTLRLYCSNPTRHVYHFPITLLPFKLCLWISLIGLYDTILASRRQCFLIVSVLGLNVGISYLADLSISFAHFTSFWQVSFFIL